MPEPERFDALFLGSGAAAKNLAPALAGTGLRTALVERRWIGGACPNVACMPSKNEIWSARVLHLARQGAAFGAVVGSISVDMGQVQRRKATMVGRLVEQYVDRYAHAGVDLVRGEGRFIAPQTVEVRLNDGGSRLLCGDKVFIDVGTSAVIPDMPGLRAAKPMTHVEALDLDAVPEHLVVLGGGYVGLEMAQAFRRFGSRVTLVERGPRVASREDADVSEELRRLLTREGVEILLSTQVQQVDGRSGDMVSVVVDDATGSRRLAATHLLVASGRRPNTDGIGLEAAGVRLDPHGFIVVNDRLETSAETVWALGECAGSPQFTHIGVDDYRIVRDNLAGGSRSTRGRLVPFCMFTDPPLARVGLGEDEARAAGLDVRVARQLLTGQSRPTAIGETDGFMKAVIGPDDRIVGFSMIGPEAGEVVATVQVAMIGGLPFATLRDAPIAHPTMAEALGPLFAQIPINTPDTVQAGSGLVTPTHDAHG